MVVRVAVLAPRHKRGPMPAVRRLRLAQQIRSQSFLVRGQIPPNPIFHPIGQACRLPNPISRRHDHRPTRVLRQTSPATAPAACQAVEW
jgi:hypothetical protein